MARKQALCPRPCSRRHRAQVDSSGAPRAHPAQELGQQTGSHPNPAYSQLHELRQRCGRLQALLSVLWTAWPSAWGCLERSGPSG